MPSIFNAFYLSIFITAIRKIIRKAVPEVDTVMDSKYIVAIPYGEYYVCGTFASKSRAELLSGKIAKLTSYIMVDTMTVGQFRLQHKPSVEVVRSIFAPAGGYIMPPDTPAIRKICIAFGQDLRSTTV